MFFARRLPREEVYITFSYSPILAEDGHTVEGIFCVCTETTERVLGERRLSTLRGLGLRAPQRHSVEAACQYAAGVLDGNPLDIAFATIYLLNGEGRTARRVASTRLLDDPPIFPALLALSDDAPQRPWPLAEATRTGRAVQVSDLPDQVGALATPLWPDLVRTALVIPLAAPSQPAPAGHLIVGVSPRRVLDADYRTFLDLVAEHIATSIADARAFEQERLRAETLAELDRAKTAFFSNVSHEFRTPLTLMMGPLEELLAKPESACPPDCRSLATVAHRNSLRLLKLVNTLLDFSRSEAGRAQASYVPADLAQLTAELASSFRSACERAGLLLEIACPPLPEPVYLDRDMWEKIVLNLLSNAFKFTFEGGIRVSLAAAQGGAELRVADTGVGIPAAELPRIFERFHRVDGQRSRSYEGSGIGLALIQELIRLHGGTIAVESEVGQGTAFMVTLPFGMAHLPAERIGGPRTLSPTSARAAAYVEEALRWLPGEARTEEGPPRAEELEEAASATAGARILLADDNADMRDYLVHLLSARGWETEAVGDGEAALKAARCRRPDLVLADVMMPGLDGLQLAAALRRDPRFTEVPVMLLSARAGEEARVEGLQAGADDYLVKPFAARELTARVESQLALSRMRRQAAERVRRSEARLKAAIDLVGLSPYSWDPVTDALDWDDRLRAMWGLRPGAPVDASVFLAGLHPEDRPRVEAAIAACADPAGNGVYHLEYRVIGIEDGVERWVSTHGQTVFEEGRPLDFVGVVLDVTERRQAEERLRASEERFRHFAEHSGDVLWILDAEAMRVEYVSPAYERVWGEPPAAMTGQGRERWLGAVSPEDRERAAEFLERARGGKGATLEYRIVRPDGRVRWIRNTAFPIRNGTGRVRRVGGIVQDLTRHEGRLVYLVAAEDASRERLGVLLQTAGYGVKTFPTAHGFLQMEPVLVPGCIVLDIGAPGAGGLTIPRELKSRRTDLPVIILGGGGDAMAAVEGMKAGAVDWLGPLGNGTTLLAAVASALSGIQERADRDRAVALARARIAEMAPREREVLAGLMAGETNKSIARSLGISPRTVEIHRAHVMERLGARTLAEAVLLASAAGFGAGTRLGLHGEG
jgi:PAS domain S-box-containing protein